MPRGKRLPELEKGQQFGCWIVVRQAGVDVHGRRRYLARPTCCGRERVREQHNLMNSTDVCRACSGPKRRAGILRKGLR